MKKNESRFKIMILILLAVIFLILALLVDEDKNLKKTQSEEQVQDKVNTYLQITNKKIEQQKNIRKIEMQHLPQVGQSLATWHEESEKLDFSSDRNELGVIQDLDSSPKDYSGYHSPQAKVQSELKQQELALQKNKEFMNAYVKEFKENARRKGYIIEVDENYVVKSVKKAPVVDKKIQLFDPSLSGSK